MLSGVKQGVACGRAFGFIFFVPQKDIASIPNAGSCSK